MIDIDAATVLLQWAAGGWLYLWVTTRRREVGLGYGWIQRTLFLLLAMGSLLAAQQSEIVWHRDLLTCAFVFVGGVALLMSLVRRSAGVAGQRAMVKQRAKRVAAMTGRGISSNRFDEQGVEFAPALDLCAAVVGLLAVIVASIGQPYGLAIARGCSECGVFRCCL